MTQLMTVRRDVAELKKRYQTAEQSYDGLRQNCEGAVCRWEWAIGALYELDPLFLLQPGIPPGRPQSTAPANLANWSVHGFDNDDRLVLTRDYTEFPSQNYYEQFYVWRPDRILGYSFHCTDLRTVINCSQLIMGPLGPTHFQRWGCRGRNSYTYACSDSRIDSFVALSGEHDEPQQSFSGELRYRPNGTVELWTKEGRNKKPVLYYQGRPPRDNPFVRHFISTWRGFA
jgi:hypothetical protein